MNLSKSLFYLSFNLFLLFSACKKEAYIDTETSSKVVNHKAYVGSQACVSCHKEAYEKWQGSHHDLAMQIANDSTILGDFNDKKVEIDGVNYRFFKKDDAYYVSVKEIDKSESTHQINYAFGVTPLQQYLIDFEDGKKQTLRATWDTVEKKWYHQYKGDKIQPNDWLHWTQGAQNWNTMCAECHSTNLKKNYDIDADAFNTTYDEINVACESCHGPAKNHINWASGNHEDENTQILKGYDQKSQLNLCAPCHARRVKLTYNLEPGKHFEDQYMLQNITSSFYHGDGQIDEEDYVYGSFKQSKMYAEGVKCNDCHDVHSLKLKFDDNQLCTQCHVPETYNTKNHHFHQENTEASLCINCHMTGKNYMGNDFRRDHSFRVPRPDQSVKHNTPNACTGCHENKSNQWAADKIKAWYGDERPDHFSDALLVSHQNQISTSERSMLDHFITDLKYPDIARSTVIENLDYSTPEQFNTLKKALKDPSASVRYNALVKHRNLPAESRKAMALQFANDTTRLVRIGAAQLVLDLDSQTLSDSEMAVLESARYELETMLFSNADFSTGRMQLGDYYLQKNDINNAIKHYEMALKKDSLLTLVYTNLATGFSLKQDYGNAERSLNQWSLIEPELARPHYLKALLFFETGKQNEAVNELKEAIKLDPNDTRSMYNLATFYYQDNKDLNQAESYIKKALKIEQNNDNYKYLLALIYQNQGQLIKAQQIMSQLPRANQ